MATVSLSFRVDNDRRDVTVLLDNMLILSRCLPMTSLIVSRSCAGDKRIELSCVLTSSSCGRDIGDCFGVSRRALSFASIEGDAIRASDVIACFELRGVAQTLVAALVAGDAVVTSRFCRRVMAATRPPTFFTFILMIRFATINNFLRK